MREEFLHYAWKFQQFALADLQTVQGQPLAVFQTGWHNPNAGPDFLQAQIERAGVRWVGHVEIHIRSSDWGRHGHNTDPAYQNVVLHVVWEHDQPIFLADGSELPALELRGRVPLDLYGRYEALIAQQHDIACHRNFGTVEKVKVAGMMQKNLADRLATKAGWIGEQLAQTKNDWEETSYRALMQGFGFQVNKEAMISLAKAMPYSLLRKHTARPDWMEALLFGVAGLLPSASEDAYTAHLQQEFSFLAHKFGLAPMPPSAWKFAKMRPPNFPSIRLAQVAAILAQQQGFFARVLAAHTPAQVQQLWAAPVSAYWQEHYVFGKKSGAPVPTMGLSSKQLLAINVAAPLLVAYRDFTGDEQYWDRAVALLEAIPAEKMPN